MTSIDEKRREFINQFILATQEVLHLQCAQKFEVEILEKQDSAYDIPIAIAGVIGLISDEYHRYHIIMFPGGYFSSPNVFYA